MRVKVEIVLDVDKHAYEAEYAEDASASEIAADIRQRSFEAVIGTFAPFSYVRSGQLQERTIGVYTSIPLSQFRQFAR